MVLTPRVGEAFLGWRPEDGDEALGLVDFSIFPHLDDPGWEYNTAERAREWAADIDISHFPCVRYKSHVWLCAISHM